MMLNLCYPVYTCIYTLSQKFDMPIPTKTIRSWLTVVVGRGKRLRRLPRYISQTAILVPSYQLVQLVLT